MVCVSVCVDIKWGDDGGLARSDSKLASGQGHKSASAGALPAVLTKGSHSSLGESGKYSTQPTHAARQGALHNPSIVSYYIVCICASLYVLLPTMFGVSVSVKMWSGERNSIDTSHLEGERVFAGRDEWDKELDKGKVSCLVCF